MSFHACSFARKKFRFPASSRGGREKAGVFIIDECAFRDECPSHRMCYPSHGQTLRRSSLRGSAMAKTRLEQITSTIPNSLKKARCVPEMRSPFSHCNITYRGRVGTTRWNVNSMYGILCTWVRCAGKCEAAHCVYGVTSVSRACPEQSRRVQPGRDAQALHQQVCIDRSNNHAVSIPFFAEQA